MLTRQTFPRLPQLHHLFPLHTGHRAHRDDFHPLHAHQVPPRIGVVVPVPPGALLNRIPPLQGAPFFIVLTNGSFFFTITAKRRQIKQRQQDQRQYDARIFQGKTSIYFNGFYMIVKIFSFSGFCTSILILGALSMWWGLVLISISPVK